MKTIELQVNCDCKHSCSMCQIQESSGIKFHHCLNDNRNIDHQYRPIKPVKADKPNMVDHPKHYNSHPSGIECITIIEHMSFNIGSAIKYLWRADEKGAPIEDLEKAVWYISREIQNRKKQNEQKD